MIPKRPTGFQPPFPANTVTYIEAFTHTPFEQLRIERLAGDASTRLYWRIKAKNKRWILLETEPFLKNEQIFPYINVQRHLKSHGINVPDIYDFSAEMGLLFVEDFGDTSLEKATQKLPPKKYAKYYFLAIDELCKIHFEASQKTSKCVAFSLDFDTEKLNWELELTKTYLFERLLKIPLSKTEEKILKDFFKTLSHHLAHQPKYFTHRDYHSRNLMIHDEKIGVLDFQDARMGTCHYDLASLLRDSYVRLPENLIEELLNHYIYEKERREHMKIDSTEFRKTFDWMSIQRNLKAMGTFAYLHIEKEKSGYLKYIPPTFAYIDENLKKFPEFKESHRILSNCREAANSGELFR